MFAFKLLSKRRNQTLGPLFINKRQVIELGIWYEAEAHLTKGYAFRPGWHAAPQPLAPHLSKKGRVWCLVEVRDYELLKRPVAQGGAWYLAKKIRVISELNDLE